LSRELEAEGRVATLEERLVLSRWSSWGAIPEAFDERKPGWASEYAELRELLDEDAWLAARTTTLDAFYTGPEIVSAVWDTLVDLGFEGGRVLEPGCGGGAFIGAAPDDVEMIGVELDATTAAITRAIYPTATVRAESFADTRFPSGYFDAAIGNVPFGQTKLLDPVHNAGDHALHNHFILKSLALTRPGGVVAVLTSSYTMDAQGVAARREMQAMADLVGAVRLPAGTHRRIAGTDVVTDLLVFRRRVEGEQPEPFTWERASSVEVDAKQGIVNDYFIERPERMLGRLAGVSTQYGDRVTVVSTDLATVGEQLREVLADVVAQARNNGLTITAPSTVEQRLEPEQLTDLWDGTIVERDGAFQRVAGGVLAPLKVAKSNTVELRALLELRDHARALLEAESRTRSDEADFTEQRAELRGLYERYVAKYGPINRVQLRPAGKTGVVDDYGDPVIDPATGAQELTDKFARHRPEAVRLLRKDPYGGAVKALENFDEETHIATPAGLLMGRVVAQAHVKLGADTPSEAIAIALDQHGTLTLDAVAGLLGRDTAETRAALGTLVFDDPVTGQIVPAAEYLSGNVRVKLDQARTAAENDERFAVNVDKLTQVLPAPVPMADIHAKVGAVWISPEVHQDFVREILRDRSAMVTNTLVKGWDVKAFRQGVAATKDWGTSRRPAPDILTSMLNQTPITVTDKVVDGDRSRDVLNPVETEAAREKAEKIQERFEAWVWEDPVRATALQTEYNVRFNSIVLRDYTATGEHMTLPGLATSIKLRPHQRAAVARMVNEPSVGLFHGVGAGKTLEMIVGATELRRLGMVGKPLFVVPNHMLDQFTREWLQAYPTARVLAASSKDLEKDARREFIAIAAANDWDGIIMTQDSFKSIGVSPEAETAFTKREIAELEDALTIEGGSDLSVKQLTKRLEARKVALQKALDITHDPGLTFETMGVDYLVVDEAHAYKNLATPSRIPGAGKPDGSKAALDMQLKLQLLREQHGERVATFATATPLANSVTEAYVMQRFLRPDLLDDAGVRTFDQWAATFGEVVTAIEMNTTGQFRQKSRFAKFQNVPELLKMFHVFADVKTAEDLQLPVPQLAARASDGKREPETVVVAPTPELLDFIDDLGRRAEAIEARAVSPEDDNMLKISSEGRAAALDVRLLDPGARPGGVTKLEAVADRVAATWTSTRDREYLDPETGEMSPVKGGLQLVFCDLGTPRPGGQWSAYSELKRLLLDRGLPGEGIRFMHDAKTDTEKAALFAAARAGHVAVLIGSTQKMGVGTNVQSRVTALHHVDCPWRPADIEQREGRAIRQGNQNPEVQIYRYVVERSFDGYMWQTLTRKATFIAQVMRGRLDAREIEDVGELALSANEAKALAQGNPLILEQAEASTAYHRLYRQEVAHGREQAALSMGLDHARSQITAKTNIVEQLEVAQTRTVDVAGDRFHMTIGDRTYTHRVEAAAALAKWVGLNTWEWMRVETKVGTIAGHDITLRGQRDLGQLKGYIALDGVPLSGSTLNPYEIGLGEIRALENKALSIPRNIERTRGEIVGLEATVGEIIPRLGQPFPKAEQLAAARHRLDDVSAKIEQFARQAHEPTPDTPLLDALGRPSAETIAKPHKSIQSRPTAPIDSIMKRVEERKNQRAAEHRSRGPRPHAEVLDGPSL
jgi:N12 class adenine-specific DNA methylase